MASKKKNPNKPHNTLACKHPKCMSKRAKSLNKLATNDTWVRFSSNPKSYYKQLERDEKKYNDNCGEVIITKKAGTE